MGTNACWIQVELRGTTREQVIATIDAYWISRGAKRGPAAWRELEKLRGLAKSGSLGIAISPDDHGWVTLCDSERYTADYALAEHLAEALATRVRYVGTWDVASADVDEYLGPGDSRCDDEPHAYYDKLKPDKRTGWAFLSFDDVDASRYDKADELVRGDDDDQDDDDGVAYVVAAPGALADPVPGHRELDDAIYELARRGASAELAIVTGSLGRSDDGVMVRRPRCTERYSFAIMFDAWLVALLITSSGLSDAAIEAARTRDFVALLAASRDVRRTIATRVLAEARRIAALPPAAGTIDELVGRIDAGDHDAGRELESAALAQRNVDALRFARAHNDGARWAHLYRKRLPV